MNEIPVITIDGPSGSGKGTLALRLANHFHWHYLDSGVLYRALGWVAAHEQLDTSDEAALAQAAKAMNLRFVVHANAVTIMLNEQDVTAPLRTEKVGVMASKVSAYPAVRDALMQLQRNFRQAPGLVTDGRDMGTIIFPDAPLKIFLDADAKVRASRRLKQLQGMGIDANIATLVQELKERDERDRNRAISPLKPAADAVIVDTSTSSIDDVFAQISSMAAKQLGLSF